MYGMSSEEFWEDDPQLYWAYRTFYLKKLEEQEMQIDYQCWLNGLYVFNAFSNVLGGMFDKDKTKEYKYIEKPITMSKYEQEQKSKNIVDANIIQQQQFNSWARF